MRNFTTNLIVAAISAGSVLAQLPHECFFLTKMHGSDSNEYDSIEYDLMSNLQALESGYKAGMKIKSITSIQDPEEDGLVTGLQLDLVDTAHWQSLKLPIVGAKDYDWESEETIFKNYQPDSISILTDTNIGGVCDVVINHGKSASYMSKNADDCTPE